MVADLALVLAAAFAGGLIARAVRLPPMVGFLAAGFALEGSAVDVSDAVEVGGDLGVTLLLFGIGLKLDVTSLVRREVWLTTVAHMAVSVAVAIGFFAVLGAAGISMLAGEGLGSLALLAFALSFSSTVFVVKVLDERSDTTTLYGRVAVGVLVLQDLAAVVFLTISRGEPPSPWAFALVLLLPGAWVIRRLWDRVGHGELQVVFGLVIALLPGYALFDAVGLKGDLGALVMGALLAGHPAASELSRTLWGLKELLLVGFFLSIGLTGLPTVEGLLVAALLLVMLPVQAAAYLVLLSAQGLRHRNSSLAALSLTNYSEFGLIVVAVSASTGWLAEDWLAVLGVAVALSFLACAAVNRRGIALAAWLEFRLPAQDADSLVLADQPIDVGDTHALVLGMGRVGRSAYQRLRDEYGHQVMGVEHDENRVEALQEEGMDVVRADATDREFWSRVIRTGQVKVAVLAMPFHGSNLRALELLRAGGFEGQVAAVAQYDDDVADLRRLGADAVFHLYGGAGTALADALVEEDTGELVEREDD